jgi:DNA-binding protein H-NS
VRESDFRSIPTDELWTLHEKLGKTLVARMVSEKAVLETRLDQLQRPLADQRRAYPSVAPKYRNPKDPSETWSGRGKQPRWLVGLLKTGKQIDEFRIATKAKNDTVVRNRVAK